MALAHAPITRIFWTNRALSPSLWVDFSEAPFSLLGLDLASPTTSHGWPLTSSNGGFIQVSGALGQPHFDFSGPEWTNILACVYRSAKCRLPSGVRQHQLQCSRTGDPVVGRLWAYPIVIARRKRRPQ